MDLLDRLLMKLGLVRLSRYEHLYDCYRDVWSWWEKSLRK